MTVAGVDVVVRKLLDHIDSVRSRDPASRGRIAALLIYPSIHVMAAYWAAHRLWRLGAHSLAHWMMQVARFVTGIEIHPGATIGTRLFIDHGMGVVIGETAKIGNDVTLYQGVTLGGVAPSVSSDRQRRVKRHPTLCDGVIIGAGAQVLGDIVVGEGARIASNAVVLHDVPAGGRIRHHARRPAIGDPYGGTAFEAYGARPREIAVELDSAEAHRRIEALEARVEMLSETLNAMAGDGSDRSAKGTSAKATSAKSRGVPGQVPGGLKPEPGAGDRVAGERP